MDYTKQLGNVDPGIADICNEVCAACLAGYGKAPTTVYGWGPNSEHNNSRCIDFMVDDDKAMGEWISKYVWANRARLGLMWEIWWQHIISVERASEGWRAMADRGDDTQNHHDHVHANFQNFSGTYVPPAGGAPTTDDVAPGQPATTATPVSPTPVPTVGKNSDSWILQVDNGLLLTYSDGKSEHLPYQSNGRWRGPKRLQSTATPIQTYDSQTSQNETAPGTSGGVIINAAMVDAATKACGEGWSGKVGTAESIAAEFNEAIEKWWPGILTSKKRAACLVGECAQETGGWYYMKEAGAGSADYAPYVGRGFCQLTWREQYQMFGEFMVSKGVITDKMYFVKDPEAVTKAPYRAASAIWEFARSHKGESAWDGLSLFEWCDKVDAPWTEISKAINCGNPKAGFTGYGFPMRTAAINAALGAAPDPVAPKIAPNGVTGGAIKPVNDYPWKNDDSIQPGNWYGGQCVSFAGWRVRSRMGIPHFFNRWHGKEFGNGGEWYAAALSAGIPITTTPKANTIACKVHTRSGYGHVAHCIEINSDGTYDVEDYNYGGPLQYAYRPNRIAGSFDYFLDFAAYAAANPGKLE